MNKDEQNNLLGYVNLPYFSRQDELKKDISSVLVTFINIYILLILFGVFVKANTSPKKNRIKSLNSQDMYCLDLYARKIYPKNLFVHWIYLQN